jgi:hypothetical protein
MRQNAAAADEKSLPQKERNAKIHHKAFGLKCGKNERNVGTWKRAPQ